MKSVNFVLHKSKCSNNCVFCSTQEFGDIEKNIKDEFDNLNKIISEGHKIRYLEISGNDPGEYPDLPNLVKKIKNISKTDKISLITHGRTLKNRKFAEELVKAGIIEFIIPIYGHNAKIHEGVTCAEGSFKDTVMGLKNLMDLNQRISVQSLITKANINYLKEMFYIISKIKNLYNARIGVPCYNTDYHKYSSAIVDFDDLKVKLSSALRYAMKINLPIYTMDIPKCLLEFQYNLMTQNDLPFGSYEHWRNNKIAVVKDNVVIPKYRQVIKSEKCRDCIHDKTCPGFYKTYYDKGYFEFNPVKK